MRQNVLALSMTTLVLFAALATGAGALGVTAASGNTDDSDEAGNVGESTFGQQVSTFVHSLQADNETDGPLGLRVANFVLANNPAADNIPDHAGPPDNRTESNETRGPPENVTQGPPNNVTTGPPANVTQGPPAHAGPAGDNETQRRPGNGGSDGDQGPPEDRGPDRSSGGSGGGNSGGPPANAGPP